MNDDAKIAKIIAIDIISGLLICCVADVVNNYYDGQTKIEAIRAGYIQHEGDWIKPDVKLEKQ